MEIGNSNVDMSLRWRIAQWCEWRWWRRYLRGKDKATYLAWKCTYWRELLQSIADVVRIEPTQHVLDLGCGPAGIYIVLDTYQVTAVDPLLSKYERELSFFNPAEYPHTTFLERSIETYIPDRCYDVIFCMNAINHVADISLAFDRLTACGCKGSTIVMTVDAHRYDLLRHLFRLIPGDILHPHQYNISEYQAMLNNRGCEIISTQLYNHEQIFDYYIIVAKIRG